VNRRATSLALALLVSQAVAVLGLVSLDGCTMCQGYDPWGDLEIVDLGVSADLHAVVEVVGPPSVPRLWNVAVGTQGTVVAWNGGRYGEQVYVERSSVGTADLWAVSAEESSWWVVGDGGMAAVSGDWGKTWTTVELAGSTANLRAIISIGSRHVVVGDDVVLVQATDGSWSSIPAPSGEWGLLRGLYHDGTRIYAVGLGGVIWSAADPSGEWVAEASGVEIDLWSVGWFYSGGYELLGQRYEGRDLIAAVGAEGTVLIRNEGQWVQVESGTTVDLVGFGNNGALGANGELFTVGDSGKLSLFETFPELRAYRYVYSSLVMVGDDGWAAFKPYHVCVGGRPFVVDDVPQTAALRSDTRWCDELPDLPTADMPPEILSALATAWAEAGLHEHASIASFARFGLELLALGAPARLLREVAVAADDERRHATSCFSLARRFGAIAVGPGPLPIPGPALARLGDPVATALALFDEGCVNESVAACEAAEAASCCRDPQVTAVLEIIAADERRHALLAWDALRWLIDRHGDRVRGPLVDRLARLGVGPDWIPSKPESELDRRLVAHGQLSPRRRLALRRQVLVELVHPLAHALLEPHATASTSELR
jgi:hypothetical protein